MSKPLDYLTANESAVIPSCRLRIYFASRISHGKIARKLLAEWPEFTFTSRWPQHHVGKVPDQANFAKTFWLHDAEDVAGCDVVLCYGEPGDTLRGALVEVGMAIALGRAVVVVGECESYGTWQYHPLVHHAGDLREARVLLRTMAL